jgi:hypothetical protein
VPEVRILVQPIRVSFDTNAYSAVTRPQLIRIITTGWPLTADRMLSKKRRVAWWYIRWCIKRGRIRAAIPEAAFAAEVLPNVDRIDFLLAIGTRRAANPPPIPDGRRRLIEEAFSLGFRALHGGRIAYGEIIDAQAGQWATDDDIQIRQDRFSAFIRHFADFSLNAFKDLGEKLSAAHQLAASNPSKARAAAMNNISLDRFLWREGIAAEKQNPLVYSSVSALQYAVRDRFADWADFDMAAAHYAYGYDLLCTEDTGKPRSDSIFGAAHAADVSGQFGVTTISLMNLAALCWRRFWFPIRKWR